MTQVDTTSGSSTAVGAHPIGPTRVLVVGGGEVAASLGQLSRVLGWECRMVERLNTADQLSPAALDAVVVLTHDVDVAGPALQRALAAGLRYVGAMGSRTTQRRRHDWLVDHQVSPIDVGRIHGPAGLAIGADCPAEIALSIVSEITAVRHGTGGGPLCGTG